MTLLTEMKQAVQGWLHEVLDASAAVESLLPRLDALQGVDRSLRELLDPRLREAYRRAVEVAASRFHSAAQDARALVAARNRRTAGTRRRCAQAMRTLLDEAHARVMQGLEERIDPASAGLLRARQDMLGAAGGLRECHAPDAQRQHGECVARLDAACKGVFALVESSLALQT